MPRSGPVYTLPEAPYVPNTVISSASVNSNLSDIADALTASLPSNGDGGMSAVLPLDATGFEYTIDPNTGMHRTAADTQAIECGGVEVIEITPTGVSIDGTLAVSGALTVGGNALILIGEMKIWPGTAAPAKWQICNGTTLVRATYPDLWAFAASEIANGNLLFTNGNGTTTFTIPDLSGRVPAGRDIGVNRLTAFSMTPNANTLGAVGGLQTMTILTTNLPAYTPSGSVSQALTVAFNAANLTSASGGGNSVTTGNFSATGALNLNAATVGGSLTFTGSAQGGASTTTLNVQPTALVHYIIYAGA